MKNKTVTFVCTGNTCRSPIAEYLFKKICQDTGRKNVVVQSAGIIPAYDLPLPGEVRKVLSMEGIASVDHQQKPVNASLVDGSDYIFVMEQHHRKSVVDQFPECQGRVHLLRGFAELRQGPNEIEDPFGQPLQIYERVKNEIKEALVKIIDKI